MALFLAGGASEAYDRYVEKYLLVDLGVPAWPGWSGADGGWPSSAALSAALGIVVPWWFERAPRRPVRAIASGTGSPA